MLIKNELKKIWIHKSTRVLLLFVVLLSFGIWYFNYASFEQEHYKFNEYTNNLLKTEQEITDEYHRLKLFEAYRNSKSIFQEDSFDIELIMEYEDYISKNNLETELKIYNDLYEYNQSIHNYHQYLKNVQDNINNLETQPYYKQYSPSKKQYYQDLNNLFINLKGVILTPINFHGLELIISSNVSYMLVIIAMIISYVSFKEDENQGIRDIILTTNKGRIKTSIFKVFAIFMSILLLVATSLLTFLLITKLKFGRLYFSFPVQAIPSLYVTPYTITVGQWIFQMFIYQVIGTMSLALVFIMIFYVVKSEVLSMLIFMSISLVSIGLIERIPEASYLVFLRHLNPFAIIHNKLLSAEFKIIEIKKIILNQETSILVLNLILILFSILIIIHKRNTRKSYESRINLSFEKMATRIFRKLKFLGFELYKLLWLRKGIIVFVVFIIIHGNLIYKTLKVYDDLKYDRDIAIYYQKHGGVLNDTKRDWIENEKVRVDTEFDDLIRSQKEFEQGLLSEDELIKSFTNYIDNEERRSFFRVFYDDYSKMMGDNLIYKDGYQALFSIKSNERDMRNAILIIIGLVLIIAPTFSQDKESGMEDLFKLTKKGLHKQTTMKLLIAIGIGLIYVMGLMISEIFSFNYIYSMSDWNAQVLDIISIDMVISNAFILNLKLYQYALILISIRSIVAIFIVSIILKISNISPSNLYSYLLSTAFLLLPSALKLSGIKFFKTYSFESLLMGNQLILYQPFLLVIVVILILTIIFLMSVRKNMSH